MSTRTVTIIAYLIILAFAGAVYYVDEHVACNRKGSLAAKINWAGHGECKE